MHWTLNWGIPHQIGNKKSILGLELVTEANSPIEEIDFGEQLARAPNYYIDYLRSQDNFDELKATNLIYKLFRDRKELVEDEDYQINWKTKVITILSPYANYDYKFFMYAPISEVNDLYDEYLQKNRADVNNVIVESKNPKRIHIMAYSNLETSLGVGNFRRELSGLLEPLSKVQPINPVTEDLSDVNTFNKRFKQLGEALRYCFYATGDISIS